MLSKIPFIKVLIVALVISTCIGINPAWSVAAMAVILAHTVADKYFHDSFHDENRNSIQSLKSDFQKIKASQDRNDIKAAFSGVK